MTLRNSLAVILSEALHRMVFGAKRRISNLCEITENCCCCLSVLNAIFQIISKRTEVATILITTNLVPSDWGKIFDAVTATAILDRLSMNGRFITFEGRSYRRTKLKDSKNS